MQLRMRQRVALVDAVERRGSLSGWLNVTIPADGREARRFLVEPLGADVFVAGTYLPSDCPSGRRRRRLTAGACCTGCSICNR